MTKQADVACVQEAHCGVGKDGCDTAEALVGHTTCPMKHEGDGDGSGGQRGGLVGVARRLHSSSHVPPTPWLQAAQAHVEGTDRLLVTANACMPGQQANPRRSAGGGPTASQARPRKEALIQLSKLITGFHRQHPDGALVIGGDLNCDTRKIDEWLSANETRRACGTSRIPLDPGGPQHARIGKTKRKVGPGKHVKI